MKLTALITGGAKRLGSHFAAYLASEGWNVGIHYNSSAKDAKQLSAKINDQGCKSDIFQADLSDPANAKGLIEKCQESLGQVDLLINNASVFTPCTLMNTDVDTFNLNMNVHAISSMILMQEFKELSKEGLIVNMLDTRVNQGRQKHVPYMLSKQALAELTKAAAVEFAPHIRVNGIAPGAILPPEGAEQEELEAIQARIPANGFGHPHNIVEALRYIIQNDYVTGQILHVDGGESTSWQ